MSEDPATQAALWNGTGGDTWVAMQPVLDRLFAPVEDVLVDAVPTGDVRAVLDVGCGTGATTIAIARRLGADAVATGVDLSEPMIALARERAARERVPARFVAADAQRHRFVPDAVDVVTSRFGVMFFDDPVAAFANLRAATRAGGALRAVVWRSPAENPFMTTAQHAAAPVLTVAPPPPGEPGQFGLADPAHVRAILHDAGWSDVAVDPVDVTGVMAEADLTSYVLRMGPVGRALTTADDATRARVTEVVRPAFAPFVHGDEVRVDLACHLITASASPPPPRAR